LVEANNVPVVPFIATPKVTFPPEMSPLATSNAHGENAVR
jgi:hypothetical protein